MQLRGRVVFIIFFESLSILGFQNQEVEWVGKWYLIHRALKPRYVSKNIRIKNAYEHGYESGSVFEKILHWPLKSLRFWKGFYLICCLFVRFIIFYVFIFFMWLNNVKWIAKFIVSHIGDSFLKIVRIFANV